MNSLFKILYLNRFVAHLNTNTYILDIVKIVIGVVAIFASAQITIPIKPVAITMHSVILCIIAFTYSPRLSFLTILTFIFIGIMGLPVFCQFSSGINYFLGAAGGYYLGFLIGIPVMSVLKGKLAENWVNVTIICIIGHIIFYLCGVIWLASIIGLKQAIYSGFVIFIPSGLAKLLIFSCLFSYIKNIKSK
ncbi:BioY family protein [Rickettsia typhi str. Wilmington]|uniref:Biotin transporter n=3 Tax=Rickettsia typhi TaxID=785 RepID=Q68X47_RICTY|nr:BioY family protein [Rickettsia typhi str. Wilmington]AFE54172.1 BioY family protein [Rickettsia typhi str. TH1527]AFE55012.1 BioY family protein [Rickettsia typhi str. B9991CWPP]